MFGEGGNWNRPPLLSPSTTAFAASCADPGKPAPESEAAAAFCSPASGSASRSSRSGTDTQTHQGKHTADEATNLRQGGGNGTAQYLGATSCPGAPPPPWMRRRQQRAATWRRLRRRRYRSSSCARGGAWRWGARWRTCTRRGGRGGHPLPLHAGTASHAVKPNHTKGPKQPKRRARTAAMRAHRRRRSSGPRSPWRRGEERSRSVRWCAALRSAMAAEGEQ
jgi:hypothetical protein